MEKIKKTQLLEGFATLPGTQPIHWQLISLTTGEYCFSLAKQTQKLVNFPTLRKAKRALYKELKRQREWHSSIST